MSGHVVSPAVYVRIFLTLIVLTAITVVVAFLDLGPANTVAALVIAMIKAMLVVLYFMHVRYGSRLIWLFLSGGFFWLAVLIVITMSDMLSRGWLAVAGK